MNQKIRYTLLASLIVSFAPSAMGNCLVKAITAGNDLVEAFEPFYPGKGAFYAQRLYLAHEPLFQKEISQRFRQCALQSHPDKATDDDGSAADRMTACNNGVEYLEAHFQCLHDLTYGAYLHALTQAKLGHITQQEADLLLKVGSMHHPEAQAFMEKWQALTHISQRQHNLLATLSHEERLEKERAEQQKIQQKRNHKSRVRGGPRAA